MQSDCCLSHHNVLKIHLKAQYEPVPLPHQSTSSFLQQLNMIQYLTFLSCTLCSFANGQQHCISKGGFVLFLMEWLIVATLKLARSFKKNRLLINNMLHFFKRGLNLCRQHPLQKLMMEKKPGECFFQVFSPCACTCHRYCLIEKCNLKKGHCTYHLVMQPNFCMGCGI